MNRRRILAITAAVLAIAAVAAGEPDTSDIDVDLRELASAVAREEDHISALTLAQWIREQRPGLHVLDLRDSDAYETLHIAQARNIGIERAAMLDVAPGDTIVLYSEGGTHSAQVWFMLRARGHRNVFFLREGMYEWVSLVLNPMLATDATADEVSAYDVAAPLARYFGGTPRRDVPREDLPQGYWSSGAHASHGDAATDNAIANVRRRGC